MYFIDQEHEGNFNELGFLYGVYKVEDPQYLANIYIAAVPEIFKLLNINSSMLSNGPLVSLMKYSDEEEALVPVHPGLTGSSTWLLAIGMSLYNGHQCSLDNRPSSEYFRAVIQAMSIRYRITGEIK